MSNKIKTAVEWLIDQIAEKQNGNGSSISMDEIFEQAKQMEKDQIIESVNEALQDANLYESFRSIKSGEQYYKENYEN